MSDRGVIGVDRPPRDKRRFSWWHLAILAVLAVAGLAALGDALITTSSEGAADAYIDYQKAAADGDGEKACSLLTPEAQEEVADQAALIKPGATCQESVHLLQSSISGESREAADKLSPEDFDISATGDRATVIFNGPLLSVQSHLVKNASGDWRLESSIEDVHLHGTGSDVTKEEAIAAGDELCAYTFRRDLIAIFDLATAIGERDREGAEAAGQRLTGYDRELVQDFALLPEGRPLDIVQPLLTPLRDVVVVDHALTVTAGSGSNSNLRAAFSRVARAGREVSQMASARGFSTSGCAAAPGQPSVTPG
jgi:hypothetical protein